MKLITDGISGQLEVITESYDNGKPKMVILKGIYAQAEKMNGNGRKYPYKELKPEMDKFIKEMVKTGRALGEFEHPDSPEIDPKKAAVRILDLVEEDKNWIGKSVVLASDPEHGIKGTPNGDILMSVIQYGTNVGFSTRGVGEIDEDIVRNYKISTIDCVANPSIGEFCTSNGSRFVNGILESKDYMIDQHGMVCECAYNQLEKKLSKMPNTRIATKKAEHLAEAVHDFFKSLTTV